MKKRVLVKIYGAVQGVSFRYYAQDLAENLGLGGYVKNEPDGSVTILAEGEKDALKRLIQWCQKGPRFAQVENIEIDWQEYKSEFNEFDIRF